MKQRKRRTWVRAAVSVLLVLVMVCTSAVAALAAVPGSSAPARSAPQGRAATAEKLTAQEKSTEQLIGDALAMNRSAVDALKQQKVYRDFLDTVAARQRTWVRAEVSRMTKVLKGMGVSPQSTVKELKASENPEARALYKDICKWLVEATEDSSVLRYSQFTSVKAIEGLDLSHLKVAEGKTAITYMTLDENDRVHGEYEEGVLENIVFDDEDIRFAAEHDLVFTAFWGKAENVMGRIHDLGACTAFDYATSNDERLPAMLEVTRGAIDYGFFSYKGIGSRDDAEPREFLKDKVSNYGMKVAVATFGEEGSLAYDGVCFYEGGVVPQPNVVNTVGAGDSFSQGARVASEVVGVFEPWVIEG